MKIGFVGMGKLGLPVAVAIDAKGHDVVGTDVNPHVREYLEKCYTPFREEGLPPLLQKHNVGWRDTVEEVVAESDLIFVAVQTPHGPEYEGVTRLPEDRADFDYTHLKNAVRTVAGACAELKTRKTVAVISTCLPGTFRREIKPLLNEYVSYVYSPLFIAMGTVLQDYLYPEFNLIGVEDPEAADVLEEFFSTINDAPPVRTDVTTAEGIKVSYNCLITAKTVIANAWGELSERLEMNFDDIFKAWSLADRRLISTRYMKAGMSDGGGCFPPGELVMTEHGPRPIETIKPGDRVLTGEGVLRPVVRLWEREYDGDLIGVKAQGLPLTWMTTDHPVYVKRDCRIRRSDGRKQTNAFPRTEVHEVYAGDMSTDHLVSWPIPQESFNRPEHATDDYLELAGWYISEGSAELSARRGRLRWDLHIDERAEAKRIAELAEACAPKRTSGRGGNAQVAHVEYPEHNQRTVRFGSKGLTQQLVADFGKGCADKSLPDWLLWGDPKLGALVLKGMILGDGHIDDRGIAYSTVSQDLAWGAFVLITKLGVRATLRDIPARVSANGQKHRRSFEVRVRNRAEARALADIVGLPFEAVGAHTVHVDKWRPVQRLERKHYRGPVYNLWVDGIHSYVVGCGAVSNCHPRDNIAMSWLAEEIGMSHNIWEDLMKAREDYEEWHARVALHESWASKLPLVVLGTAFKPETDITTGSPATLVANILDEMGATFLHVDDMNSLPVAVYFIATQNARYADYDFPEGSVVIDPFGYIPDRVGVKVRRLGRK